MSSVRVLASFLKTIRADRALGAATDRDSVAFEQLYRHREDPWGLRASPFTQYRYLALLERIAAFTPCQTLLDVGCGEGLFTRYLSGVAANVVGIDLSATAIERARRNVPRADFCCVALQDFTPDRRFDVVVAAEMLYYADDVARALGNLSAFGDVVLVSYARARAPQIEAKLRHVGDTITSTFHSFFQSDTHGFTIASFGRRAERGSAAAIISPEAGILSEPALSAADWSSSR
jgi:SAM-dependent methyltransferase